MRPDLGNCHLGRRLDAAAVYLELFERKCRVRVGSDGVFLPGLLFNVKRDAGASSQMRRHNFESSPIFVKCAGILAQ
jgi:hypothetical protein